MNAITTTRTARMLGADEERQLFARHSSGDRRATRLIIDAHLPLVNKIAGSYSGFGRNHDDIVQEGLVGLLQGLDRFNPDLGFRINTFCRWWIRASISEWVRYNHSLIRLGTTPAQKKAFGSLADAKAKLGIYSDTLTRGDVTRLAAALAIPESDVSEMHQRMSPGAVSSMDAPIRGEDGGVLRVETMPDTRSTVADLEEGIDDNRRRAALADALVLLDPRKRDIINRRYLSEEVATLEELSEVHGVSRERIRQLEVQAIEILGLALPGRLSTMAGQDRRNATVH